MSLALGLLLAFVAAAVNDWLSCRWQAARERRDVRAGAALAMLIEGLGWAPFLVAIELQDPRLAIGAVLGAGVGSVLGFRGR